MSSAFGWFLGMDTLSIHILPSIILFSRTLKATICPAVRPPARSWFAALLRRLSRGLRDVDVAAEELVDLWALDEDPTFPQLGAKIHSKISIHQFCFEFLQSPTTLNQHIDLKIEATPQSSSLKISEQQS